MRVKGDASVLTVIHGIGHQQMMFIVKKAQVTERITEHIDPYGLLLDERFHI